MKRIIALALICLLLVSITSAYGAAPGSAADPLISQSFVSGSFRQSVVSDSAVLINNALAASYDSAGSKLKSAYDSYMARLGVIPGYSFAPSFTPVNLPSGATAGLVTGSTLILVSGAATLTIQSGAVINLSTGQEVTSGASLVSGQRYFCAEDTTATVTAASGAICQLDGYYTTTGTVIISPMPFLDVRDGDWFNGAVAYVTGKRLFTGTSASTFSPLDSMTRGMFVTVLYRLAGKPGAAAAAAFPDNTDSTKYYYDAVVWANASKVVTGYSDGMFHPDDAITREQMAVIISRYASFAGYSTTPGSASAYNAFSDTGSVSGYAVDAMKWATSAGILNGSDGRLLPKNTASRAQVAQIILNFCQKVAGI